MKFTGTKKNDDFTGTKKADIFDLSQGGNDKASGGNGNDSFIFKGAFTAKDRIDGGNGNDTLSLSGNYAGSHKVVFGAGTMVGVETIALSAHHDYTLTTNNATVAAGKSLTVDGSKLGAGDVLTFNGSAETNGSFHITGGKGNDVLTGGAKNDTFDLSLGGNDTVKGGSGNDTFSLGGKLDNDDAINGGSGNDTLRLNGAYNLTLQAGTLSSIENIVMAAGHNYTISQNPGALSGVLTVDGSALGAANHMTYDADGNPNDAFHVTGGKGNDTVVVTEGNIATGFSFDGGNGNDAISLAVGNGGTTSFNTSHVTSLEELDVSTFALDPVTFDVTINNATVSAGQTLTVNFTGSTSGDTLIFDGSAETNGKFDIIAGIGNTMTLTGGAKNDIFEMHSEFDSGDSITGGGGDDLVKLDAAFGSNPMTVAIDHTMISGISEIGLVGGSGQTYDITIADDINFTNLTFGDFGSVAALTFDGSAETTGSFTIDGSTGNDTLTGGQQGDNFDFSFSGFGATFDGNDIIDGGAGPDILQLDGDYSALTILSTNNLTSVETVRVEGADGYNLAIDNSFISGSDTLTIDGSQMTGGIDSYLFFDATRYTGSGKTFDVTGGSGATTLTMTHAIAPNTFNFTGGEGNDTVVLDGTGASDTLALTTTNLTGVDDFILEHGNAVGALSVQITETNNMVASGKVMSIYDSNLGGSDSWTFDGSAETDGSFHFSPTLGHATLTGGDGADTFDFTIASALNTSTIDGGDGTDTLDLTGAGFNGFSLSQLTSVETIVVRDSNTDYSLTLPGANMSDTDHMTVDATALTGHGLSFDASSVTIGDFTFEGGGGNDALSLGGPAVLNTSIVEGGAGNDALYLHGDYSSGFTFSGQLVSVETIVLQDDSANYDLTTDNSIVAAGATLTVDGSGLSFEDSLTFDGSAETNGHFDIRDGQGDDDLTGGKLGDIFDLSTGGSDLVIYTNSNQSAGTNYDTINHFDAANDTISFVIAQSVTVLDANQNHAVSSASLTTDLAAAVAGHLGAGHAITVTATSGDLNGDVFLVVDANGNATYDAASDMVIALTNLTGTLSAADFTNP